MNGLEKGSLPDGWRWVRLGEVCDIVSGSTPSTSIPDYWDGDIPWVTPTDLGELDGPTLTTSQRRITKAGLASCSAQMVPPGTVLMSSRAPIGHLAVANVACCTNQGCKNLVPTESLDTWYLFFALKMSVPELKALGSGATFTEISKTAVESFEIPLPPLFEQRRIAAILKEQMVAVERARAAAEAELELSASLIEAYLRQSLSNGNVRRIPLRECLQEVSSGVGAAWRNYPAMGATRDGIAPAKEAVGKDPERYKLVEPGTIFYNPMRILIGSIAMIDEGEVPGITSPDYVVFKTAKDGLHPRWFYYWLRSSYGQAFIKSLARGAVRERMLFRRLVSAEIDVPSWESQLDVAEKLKSVAYLRRFVEAQLDTINKLPAALLRKAFSGEL